MTAPGAAAVASSGGAALSLLPAAQLLVDGRVRVRGVWPGGVDVEVTDGGRTWLVRERWRVWSCPCPDVDGCAHVTAAALVVPVRAG